MNNSKMSWNRVFIIRIGLFALSVVLVPLGILIKVNDGSAILGLWLFMLGIISLGVFIFGKHWIRNLKEPFSSTGVKNDN